MERKKNAEIYNSLCLLQARMAPRVLQQIEIMSMYSYLPYFACENTRYGSNRKRSSLRPNNR